MQLSLTTQWERPSAEMPTSAQEVGLGLPSTAERLRGQSGAPNQTPHQLLSKSCFSVPSRAWTPHRLQASPGPAGVPFCFSKDWRVEECSCFSCPTLRSHAPPEHFSCLQKAPNSVISCLVPWNPRRPGEHWNVRCLRSEPEFDLSWVEMRGKWPRTTRSFTSFPDLAAAGAGLPNQAGFGQDICSSAGHKAHLDPLRELRAIKFP